MPLCERIRSAVVTPETGVPQRFPQQSAIAGGMRPVTGIAAVAFRGRHMGHFRLKPFAQILVASGAQRARLGAQERLYIAGMGLVAGGTVAASGRFVRRCAQWSTHLHLVASGAQLVH